LAPRLLKASCPDETCANQAIHAPGKTFELRAVLLVDDDKQLASAAMDLADEVPRRRRSTAEELTSKSRRTTYDVIIAT
jgi:hypothetical protein